MQSNFKCPCLNHHNFLLKMIKFYLEQWQLFGFLVEISNLWKLFETNWVELNVKWHHPKHEYQKSINFYNYFIYPNRDHTCKTNAVLLTSVKKCQQYCIGKCRCYDLYTTPICNVSCHSLSHSALCNAYPVALDIANITMTMTWHEKQCTKLVL